MDLLEKHTENLKSLCVKFHVDKLYAFGSILNSNFNQTSDIDFLVKFKKIELAQYFDNYINLKENLKKLLGRDIDLVEEQTLKNPILIKSINRNKALVYG